MSLGDGGQQGAKPRARAGARTWPPHDGIAARPLGGRSDAGHLLEPARARLRERLRARLIDWIASDTAPGRLIPWLPVAFSAGVILYFAADTEPNMWAACITALVSLSVCIAVRARPLAWPVMLAVTAMTMGLAAGTLRTARLAHPVLTTPAFAVSLQGFVEMREERERTDRITIRVQSIEGPRLATELRRVRLSLRKGTAPPVASFVALRARLNPPLAPVRPGGYDFARDQYFQGIGASGFVLGQVRILDPPQQPDWRLRGILMVSGLRDAVDARIRSILPGDAGAIASALITGKRGAISAEINEAMYVSSLGHILAISGYHMAVVAGAVFFIVRASLAMFPAMAGRYPIKKWAALTALAFAAFYLVLSGAAISTQRAFIMTAMVLIGVMADRPALTLRTLSVAALVILLMTPEAIVHPSFQMSFAATLALIAAYERGIPFLSAVPDQSRGVRMALWGGRELLGLVVVSLVAGCATTLFAAYHFHRLAPYGLLSNLLAMPLVSVWVMPTGLAGLIMYPFGLDRPFWWMMGEGIGWMVAIAAWVSGLPGAAGRISAFGTLPLVLGTAGLLAICLLRTPLRWSGALLLALCLTAIATERRADVLVSADGRMVAVRDAGGTLRVMATRQDRFVLQAWLAADGDSRAVTDPTLREGIRCDGEGCVARLPGGQAIAMPSTAEALVEDCAEAALVVTIRQGSASCAAALIDRDRSRVEGAIAAFVQGGIFTFDAARPRTPHRPWMGERSATAAQPSPSSRRPTPVDATPQPQDLDGEDGGSVAAE